MSARQVIGLIGSIILIIGVFAPVVSVPIVGGINYFRNGEGDGTFILILGLISMVLVLAKKYNWLWFTSICSIAILSFSYFFFNYRMEQASAELKVDLGNNPFAGIADAALQTVQIEWGMPLLLVGAFFLIGSAVMKDESKNIVVSYDNKNTDTAPNKKSIILLIGVPIIVLLLFLNFAFYTKKETDTSISGNSGFSKESSSNVFAGNESNHNSKPDSKPSNKKDVFIDEDAL